MTNIYAKDVSNIKVLDPYRLQELYQMHPCAEHVVKKLLVAGEREGGKDLDTDISDCIRTLTRWQAMRAEDAGAVGAPRWATHTLLDGDGRKVFVRQLENAPYEFHEFNEQGDLASVFNPNNYQKGSLKALTGRPQ